MSRFLSGKYSSLTPYTPGEQPKERKYIKLNTNESPFPPSKKAVEASRRAAESLELYSDPEIKRLTEKIAEMCRVAPECVICTNGSDEILNFAFMAFCDREHPAVFPDITYGFYPVFAELNGVPYKEIPLREDFTVNVDDYVGINKNILSQTPMRRREFRYLLTRLKESYRQTPTISWLLTRHTSISAERARLR